MLARRTKFDTRQLQFFAQRHPVRMSCAVPLYTSPTFPEGCSAAQHMRAGVWGAMGAVATHREATPEPQTHGNCRETSTGTGVPSLCTPFALVVIGL